MDSRMYMYTLWRAQLCLWLAAVVYLADAKPVTGRNRLQSVRQATNPPRLICADPGIPTNGYRIGYHSTFYGGHQVSFGCLPGYELEGAKRIFCKAYHYDEDKNPAAVHWDADLPHCLPISPPEYNTIRRQLKQRSTDPVPCSDYGDLPFGHRNITGTQPGDTVTFSCDEGFALLGNPKLTCETDGFWSGAWPMCVGATLGCGDPGTPEFGRRLVLGTTQGSTVEYSCIPGCVLRGESVRICTESGEWSGSLPLCEAVDCGDPSAPDNGNAVTVSGDTTYEAVASYNCQDGYLLSGSEFAICQENNQWNNEPPLCTFINCGHLSDPVNGRVDVGATSLGSTASYICSSGYALMGQSTRECTESGSWSGSAPSCKRGSCGTLEDPENGIVIYSGRARTNSRAVYECNIGYFLTGDWVRTCLGSGWTGSTPTCVPVECPFPTIPPNTLVSLTNGTFSYSVATYSCREGFRLHGGYHIRQCQPSGIWTGTPPGCYAVDCGAPEDIHHGTVNYTSTLEGSEAIYQCDDGYELSLGDMIRTCMGNRQWSGTPPCCIPIDCNPLDQPTNGGLNLTNGLQLDSVATYLCDEGYILVGGDETRVCSSVGWTGFEPTCQVPSICDELQNPENGQVFFTGTTLGSVATYNCSQGYVLSGPSTRECQPSGEWSDTEPSCPPIECEETLTNPDNGVVDVPSTTFMSVATYTCINRHTLIGDSERMCLADGTWSGTQPECQFIECPELSDPEDGSVTLVPNDNIPGTEAIYSCDPGLGFDGPPSRICQLNGEWTGRDTTCTAVSCGILNSPDNGLVQITGDTPGDEAVYRCDDDRFVLTPPLLVRICLGTGQWTGTDPMCLLKRCPYLTRPANGAVEFDIEIGSTANYTCMSGYRLVGVASRECQDDGQWTNSAPTCEQVMCPELDDPLNGGVRADNRLPLEYAMYFCDDGFELQPNTLLRVCGQNGQWGGLAPSCVPLNGTVTCPVLMTPEDGSLDLTSTAVGTVVTYTCNDGYQLVNGSEQRTCQDTGEWDGSAPTCEFIQCPPLTNPANGQVTVFGTSYQESATYKCNPGYRREGTEIRICLETGEWSLTAPTCEEVDCGPLPNPLNGMVQLSPGTLLSSTATYTCNTGFARVGDDTRMCGSDGLWTGEEPTCEPTGTVIECGDPGTPENGYRDLSTTTTDSIVEYFCDSGFILEGDSTRVCQADRSWSETLPECLPVMCPPLAHPVNGEVRLNGMSVGSQATYLCGGDYQLSGPVVRECGANGQWAGVAPTCVPLQCPSLRDPQNGEVDINSLEVDSTANFSCDAGFVISGASMLICESGGVWSDHEPTCERVQCTDPGVPNNGRRIFDDFTASLRVYFVCDDGFEMEGFNVLLCGEDGAWDNPTPTCSVANMSCNGSDTTMDQFGRSCTCVNGQLQSCCRPRPDWSTLTDEEKLRYISAVLQVSTEPTYQQLYYKLVEDYATSFDTIAQVTDGQTSQFFPWHRYFLLMYEDLLRMVDQSITIPYWDWTRMPSTPYQSDVFDPTTGFGNSSSSDTDCVTSGPFAEGVFQVTPNAGGGCLERQYNNDYIFPSRELLDTQVLSYIAADFTEFHRVLRISGWLNVRCYVGGHLCFRTAANDPLYPLHLARVDLVLDQWQSLDGDRAEARYATETDPLVLTLDENLIVSDFSSNSDLRYGASVCYGALQ